MDKKISIKVAVAIWQAVISLILGTVLLFLGFFVLTADGIAIMTGGGGNLTGLGIIIGLILLSMAQRYLIGFVSAARLLKQDLKGKSEFTIKEKRNFIFFIIIVIVCAAIYAVQANAAWNKQIAAEQQEQARIKEHFRLEDEKILKEFESKEIVSVKFSFNFADDYEAKRKAKTSDLATLGALNVQFVRDHIIDPIGTTDMPSYQVAGNTIEYSAEVTKAGYAKLRKNKYAERISLKK